jgi:regulator of PEP synthase PpsR (kinase-PPPase family)
VDVTHKSIEETAAAIMNLLETRGRLRETGDGGVHPS